MDEYESRLKAEHGAKVLFEDRGEIDTVGVQVDIQPCSAVDHMLTPYCKNPGIYRISGNHRDRHKGARWRRLDRHLCAVHLAAWAALHGTTVEELLSGIEETT